MSRPRARASPRPTCPWRASSRRGKVRELYDLGDAPAARRERPHLRLRLRPAPPAFRTRERSSRSSRTSGSHDFPTSRTICSRPKSSVFPRSCSRTRATPRRPLRPRAKGRGRSVRVRGARVPRRLRLGSTTDDGRGLRASGFPPGLVEGRPAPRADLHPGDQERVAATTRTSPSQPWRPRSAARRRSGCEDD